ncbi:hypothetical protein A4G18_00530 [Pasteurellaceae bacterium Pebbles2]|nr:hypothetical protein [Pasteurellaceae bacterium Pebbles2]
MFCSFKKICVQWGYWATPRLETDYPCMTKAIPLPVDIVSYRVSPIDERLALKIDECLCVMKKVNPELYELFVATYAYRCPVFDVKDANNHITKGILTRFSVSKTEYYAQLKAAEIALEMMLYKDRTIMMA